MVDDGSTLLRVTVTLNVTPHRSTRDCCGWWDRSGTAVVDADGEVETLVQQDIAGNARPNQRASMPQGAGGAASSSSAGCSVLFGVSPWTRMAPRQAPFGVSPQTTIGQGIAHRRTQH